MSADTINTETAAVEAAAKTSALPLALIVVAVVLAVVAVLIFLFMRKRGRRPFSEIQQHQVTVDILKPGDLLNWTKAAHLAAGSERVVAYANKRWIQNLGYEFPPSLDPGKNVICFETDKTTGNTTHICLFSFSEMDDSVKKLFGEKDCFFLRD